MAKVNKAQSSQRKTSPGSKREDKDFKESLLMLSTTASTWSKLARNKRKQVILAVSLHPGQVNSGRQPGGNLCTTCHFPKPHSSNIAHSGEIFRG